MENDVIYVESQETDKVFNENISSVSAVKKDFEANELRWRKNDVLKQVNIIKEEVLLVLHCLTRCILGCYG